MSLKSLRMSLISVIGSAALWRTHTTYGKFIWLSSGLWFTAKSLAIVCAFLMDSLPLVVKWPLWVLRGAQWGLRHVPSVSGLEAQKWVDSISGPITFSLAHVRRDLKPRSGHVSVRGQGSHAVHISMQVEAAWHWIIFLAGESHYFEAKHTSPPHDLHLHFALLEDNEWHHVMKRMWPQGG